jgi:membrane protein implicated in regulation of membrane protease activity
MILALTIPQLLVLVGLLLVITELFIGIEAGFDLVLIGTILILGGFSGIVTNSLTVALVVSSVLAVLYIFYGRKSIRQKLVVITHKTNIDKLVGKKGVVIRSITPDTAGLVRLDDEDWRAASNQVLHEKDKVQVESLEGVTLMVKKV